MKLAATYLGTLAVLITSAVSAEPSQWAEVRYGDVGPSRLAPAVET